MRHINVENPDREKEIEMLRMALNMCEIGVDYQHAELIKIVMDKLQILKLEFSLNDASELYSEWMGRWEYYEEKQNKKNEKS